MHKHCTHIFVYIERNYTSLLHRGEFLDGSYYITYDNFIADLDLIDEDNGNGENNDGYSKTKP